jgi:hypothetical protein
MPCIEGIVHFSQCKCTPFSAPCPAQNNQPHLSLLESSWETLDVVGQLAVVAQELDVGTINQDLTLSLLLEVLIAAERGEAPVLGDNDLLAARELVL